MKYRSRMQPSEHIRLYDWGLFFNMMPRNNENQTLFLKINRVSLGMPFSHSKCEIKHAPKCYMQFSRGMENIVSLISLAWNQKTSNPR